MSFTRISHPPQQIQSPASHSSNATSPKTNFRQNFLLCLIPKYSNTQRYNRTTFRSGDGIIFKFKMIRINNRNGSLGVISPWRANT